MVSLGEPELSGEPQQGDIAGLLQRADETRRSGRIDEAVLLYHQILELAPENPWAHVGLGHSARERGDRHRAVVHFAAAAGLRPYDAERLLDVADDLRALERLDAAEALYRRVLELVPTAVRGHVGMGLAARVRGDRQRSLKHFEAAAEIAPESVDRLLNVADDLRVLDRLDEAESLYQRVLELAPMNVWGHVGLGHVARHRGDRRISLAHFEAAALLVPESAERLLDVADDLRVLDLLDEAEAQYLHVLRLAPENAWGYVGLGHVARRRGNRQVSLAHFESAARLLPDDENRQLDVADDLRELDRLDEAEALYRRIQAVAPKNIWAPFSLGYCARKRGQRGEALRYFQTAAQIAPDNIWPWIEIANEQREAGDTQAARKAAKAILEVHPDNVQALLSIAETERYDGHRDAAVEMLKTALTFDPENPDILVKLAVEERLRGDRASFDIYLAEALALDPHNVAAVSCLADLSMRAGDAEQAYEIYEQAAQARPRETAFQLGLLDAQIAMGEVEAALAGLTAFENARGPYVHARDVYACVKRLSLLRQSGRYHEALTLAREAAAVWPNNFTIWMELFQAAFFAGGGEELEACLRENPASTQREQGLVRRNAGFVAASCWRINEAVEHYAAAAAAHEEDAYAQNELARMKLMQMDLAGAREHLRRARELEAGDTQLRGKSLNISQTFYGQLLDEYRLNETMLGRLQALWPLEPEVRAAAIRDIVRAEPDNTAAAMSLLLAMRQSGPLRLQGEAGGGPIPPTITQFWDPNPIPGDLAGIMQSWRAFNPDHIVQVFDDKRALAYISARYPPPVAAAYRRTRELAQKSDILRLAWLAAEGGVYVDADDRCLQPLAAIIPPQASLVLYQEHDATLGNNFIAASPGHPVLRLALDMAVTAVNRADSDIVWLATGPGLLTRAFCQLLAGENAGLPGQTIVLDRREAYRAVGMHCMARYKRTNKHWLNAAFVGRKRVREKMI